MTKNKDFGVNIVYTSENTRQVLKTDSIVDSIVDKFIDRASMGKEKYGTDLDRQDLNILEWIEHAQQEMMDGILYLEKIKQTLGGRK